MVPAACRTPERLTVTETNLFPLFSVEDAVAYEIVGSHRRPFLAYPIEDGVELFPGKPLAFRIRQHDLGADLVRPSLRVRASPSI